MISPNPGSAAPFDDGLADTIVGLDDDGRRYPIAKLDAHLQSISHLAVSVFLLRGEKLLLQRRAAGKYHAPLLWANTACSHPLWGETPDACVARTLHRELGFCVPTRPFTVTRYKTRVGDLFENETVHCYCGELPSDFEPPAPNRDEVDAVRWATFAQIEADLAMNRERYAPWFRIYVETGILGRLVSS